MHLKIKLYDMNKNITFFICSLGSGGAEHQMTTLAHFLLEKNYNIQIVTFAADKDHYPLNKDVKRIRLGSGKGKFGQMFDIWRFFLSVKTDVVISFGQRENLFCLLPLLFRRGIKVIAGDRNTTYGKPSRIEKLLHGFFYRRATWIVPNSFAQGRYIKKEAPKFADKVNTIINYTDINAYVAKPLPNNKPLRFGLFCRYNPQKNYERFAYAVKQVVDAGYQDFIIDWYGNTKLKASLANPHYEKLVSLVQDLKIGHVLHLHDKISHVADEMARCDAIILPSLFEGFSNTISEAISCGRSVLCGAVADNGVMIENGKNGFLFNPESVSEIAESIQKYLNLSDEQKSQMSVYSRQRAEELFSKDRFVNSYISLIEG